MKEPYKKGVAIHLASSLALPSNRAKFRRARDGLRRLDMQWDSAQSKPSAASLLQAGVVELQVVHSFFVFLGGALRPFRQCSNRGADTIGAVFPAKMAILRFWKIYPACRNSRNSAPRNGFESGGNCS
jgi:hypothetical protein